MRHGIFSRLLACVLASACVLSLQPFSVNAQSAADSQQTVKVGVLNNTTYAYQDQDGVWRGIDVECMISIAQKAGFKVEFVDSSNDPDFMANLDNGTYDILADIVQTEDRKANYLFTDEAIGSNNSMISVRATDDRWDYGDVNQISQMTVGVLASYANNADFRSWCTSHALTPKIIEYKNMQEMIPALASGEIDGAVHSTAFDESNKDRFRTIMKFLPESYYYAFRKDDVELKNKVDSALAQILSANSDYLVSLKNKYEVQFESNILPYSSAEKEYLAAHPVIRLAVVSSDQPYYSKSADGAVSGILPDYYDLIAQQMGVKFEYAEYATHEEAVAAVCAGNADAVAMFSGGPIAAYQDDIALTDSITSVNNILLTKAGVNTASIKSIAVKSRAMDALRSNVLKLFPDAELVGYANAQECFAAMENGTTDAALMGMPSATWLINQTNSTQYSVIPVSGIVSELCGGVSSSNQILCSILNKSIAATRGSFTGISTRDTLPQSDWRTTISRIPPALTAGIGLLLVLLVIGLAWALFQLRIRQKERSAVLAAQAETRLQKVQVESMRKNAEDRNQFFANISHDMRTPLNAITGYIRLAQKDTVEPEQRKVYLDKAEKSSRLLLDLINDTLTVSKMSSGKMELHPAACRTTDLVEAVVTPIRAAAEKKNITFTVDVSEMKDCWIQADRLNLEKIFLNLLTNAVKYTPEGGHVWYIVRQDPAVQKELHYTVTVRDNGIGVSKEFLSHIFEPFAQEKRQGYDSVGTGLGLSIVRQLVELMGGTVEVQSEMNAGTTFVVRLQFAEAHPDAAAPAAAAAGDLKGCRVLLCEDNEFNREIAVSVLSEKDLAVETAADGQAGVEKFEKSAPGYYQIILMDLRMPVLDGYQAARRIRSLERADAKTVPILAMTADAFEDDVKACLEAGMNGHIAKPIDPEVLFREMKKAMQ
jgi:signal transduction histidine kinase/ActR/RegA family two-component response regulator